MGPISCASCASCGSFPFTGAYSHLIRPGENHAARGVLAALDAFAFFRRRVLRDVADGSFGFFLHALLALARSAPMRPQKAALAIKNFQKLGIVIDAITVLLGKLVRAGVHRLLNRVQHLADCISESILRCRRFLAIIAASERDLALLQVLGPYFDAQRNAAFLPFI